MNIRDALRRELGQNVSSWARSHCVITTRKIPKQMDFESTLYPPGHIRVVFHCNNETNLEAFYAGVLSRSLEGTYSLTQTMGKRLTSRGTKHDGALHRVERVLTVNEALVWLEHALCVRNALGDSPYEKQRIVFDPKEIKRLARGNELADWFFPNTKTLVEELSRSKK